MAYASFGSDFSRLPDVDWRDLPCARLLCTIVFRPIQRVLGEPAKLCPAGGSILQIAGVIAGTLPIALRLAAVID
jgi:hypothetical protein